MDIHRCRFVPYPPAAINALAFSHPSDPTANGKGPLNLRLAIGRANGDIEIWNPLKGVWYQERIFRGGKDRTIEGLVWTQDPEDVDKNGYKIPGKLRLFSIGLSTAVTEWDLASGRPSRHSAGNYADVWCMAAQPKADAPKKSGSEAPDSPNQAAESQEQSIAVGCADGAVVVLSTSDDDLRFTKTLARPSKKGARVLSLTFQNRYTIIAGHADSTIRVYDTRNGRLMRNMTLGAGPKGGPKEILVWSVKCLRDGTVVSGDSTGTVCFWDGKFYTLIQRIKSHDTDILELAVSVDSQSVFSGGMDRRTTLYRRTGRSRPGEKHPWAKIAHHRLHKHDVKTMATFETKGLSVLASGGLDTAPIIVPIQEFGREHHRTLSNLPQQSTISSAPKKRLMMSWWDREISIWSIRRSRGHQEEGDANPDPINTRGRKLLAKIALQGEESITCAELSSDGTLLAVLTVTEFKLFRLRPKLNGLKVQKIEINEEFKGGNMVKFSPDGKWLCIVKADNVIHLHRLVESKTSEMSLRISPKTVILKRLARDPVVVKPQQGTLGNYNRFITRVAFSADSRILAAGDLSGYLDTWVLEGHEDLTQEDEEPANDPASSAESSSDEDSDEEEHPKILLGQHWIRNPAASLLTKLPAAPLVLSFRPSSSPSILALTNGNTAVHPTRHNPHPHSHDLPNGEDRLFVLTAENHMYEFNVLSGKLSDWSRRNPTSSLPQEFRGVRDRAKGAVWDVRGHNKRIWLYGISWLWMFDLSRDLSPLHEDKNRHVENEPEPSSSEANPESKQRKRKRTAQDVEDPRNIHHQAHDTGAGSKITTSELATGVGRKIHKINGVNLAESKWISLDREEDLTSDDEYDADTKDMALVNLRRATAGDATEADGGEAARLGDHQGLPYWHTYKYRPILDIVPLEEETEDEDAEERPARALEVALVERPLWDLELPDKYFGEQEWDP